MMDRQCTIGGVMGALLVAHRRGLPVSLIRSVSGDAYRGQKRVLEGGQ